ncbi:GNAT family N-acetyltransferase [Brevibacterium sp. 50QC2O2]|uniref:bifunctional acetate--CoA ligase family protein/GNAT family N-acetyltransferase n=1 Tax=Brevibacterium sp. 50QC2O2 TaxID=2968459 RepID=UPI00211CFE01|nr:GNAT family N-acetyltransferase [Brevibacterium sp. 50QC2O2]MCQ9387386.1 GNAT family N-acetyltransferase [Brevibacterium sp. 50QC2O2]
MDRYPADWEADVVLRDGQTAHLRPIVPEDAQAVQDMHARQSAESIYLRYFAPLAVIPEAQLQRFVNVDYHDRVALVITIGEEIIGIGRFDRLDDSSAEVAFNIADAHQGRGLGSILLEHLAAIGREVGITQFTAEVLPQNRSMLQVFAAAGFEVSREFEDGVVAVRFEIDPTEKSIQVQESREHRAEALSVRSVLHPASVVVIGASRKRTSAGNLLLRNLVAAGYRGSLHVVHHSAAEVAGIPAEKSLADIDGDVDLAVIAVPAEAVKGVVLNCAEHGVKAVAVISSGFAEEGPAGAELQREVVAVARSHGMRVIGPNSFGLINNSTEISLNASLSPIVPEPGSIGLFNQSGALATAMLQAAKDRGLGISTFVSAGNRADLSGNDVLQYWEEDPETKTIGLYLESIGNPRKFSRIARRVTRTKPVIVIKSDLTGRELPPGHQVRVSSLSPSALDQVLAQAGVLRAANIGQLFDLAQVFSNQPLPAGRRVGVIGNSAALSTLVVQQARAEGLRVERPAVSLHPEVTAGEFEAELRALYADDAVDSVVVNLVPSAAGRENTIAETLAEVAAKSEKTTVAVFMGIQGLNRELTAYTRGTTGGLQVHRIPSYLGPENAVWALARATEYAVWRGSDHGTYPELDDVDTREARTVIETALARATEDRAEVRLEPDEVARLLGAYQVRVLPQVSTASVDEALAAAAKLGYPVALKPLHRQLRHRVELGAVKLDVSDPDELREDYQAIIDIIDAVSPGTDHRIDVQTMAEPGTPCIVRAGEDPLLGPMVSFALAGDAAELLDDVAHRVAPLTDVDAAQMIRGLGSSPRLFGYKGLPVANVFPVELVLIRLSALVDRFPMVRRITLRPITVTTAEPTILSATVTLSADSDRMDSRRRRMNL